MSIHISDNHTHPNEEGIMQPNSTLLRIKKIVKKILIGIIALFTLILLIGGCTAIFSDNADTQNSTQTQTTDNKEAQDQANKETQAKEAKAKKDKETKAKKAKELKAKKAKEAKAKELKAKKAKEAKVKAEQKAKAKKAQEAKEREAQIVPEVEEPATDPDMGTCTKAKSAGYGPYTSADAEYNFYQDRDGDGTVCE